MADKKTPLIVMKNPDGIADEKCHVGRNRECARSREYRGLI